jgi:hypothetical protein
LLSSALSPDLRRIALMRRLVVPFAACLSLLLASGLPAAGQATEPTISVAPAGVSLAGGDLHLALTVGGTSEPLPVRVLVDGVEVHRAEVEPGESTLTVEGMELAGGDHEVVVEGGGARASGSVRAIPGWVSVVPPLVAIALALIFKDVLVSLFLGVFAGALILVGGNPVSAFARSIDGFVSSALADESHAKILIFSTLLGGMVGIISKSGGTRGIVEQLSRFASNTRRGQLATWAMGVAIFFDDYANTLISCRRCRACRASLSSSARSSRSRGSKSTPCTSPR